MLLVKIYNIWSNWLTELLGWHNGCCSFGRDVDGTRGGNEGGGEGSLFPSYVHVW